MAEEKVFQPGVVKFDGEVCDVDSDPADRVRDDGGADRGWRVLVAVMVALTVVGVGLTVTGVGLSLQGVSQGQVVTNVSMALAAALMAVAGVAWSVSTLRGGKVRLSKTVKATALAVARDRGGVELAEVCRRVGLRDDVRVERALDRMMGAGWVECVESGEGGARRVLYRLTDEGMLMRQRLLFG